MLGNFAGFVAPVVFGYILGETGDNWTIVMYTMSAAAVVSATCWLFLDPDKDDEQKSAVPASAVPPQ
jgi:nitrate/nitrite transporter NarK